jgi:hypothetical protein
MSDGNVKERTIQDGEVHELANLRRDTSLQVVGSQVTEHTYIHSFLKKKQTFD